MNIFDYEGKEFDKKLDEIFKNKSKEELKQELIECGLKVGVEMEEDIKYKKILNNRLDYLKCNYAITNEDLKAIKYLLNRNKELEEKVKIIDHMCLVNKEEYQLIKNNDYIPKSKVREARNKFDEMVQKLYAEGKEITDRDVFILFDELLEGDK